MLRFFLAVAILLVATSAASAGDYEDRDYDWVRQRVKVRNYVRCDEWWSSCSREWRYVTRWVKVSRHPRLQGEVNYAPRGDRIPMPDCKPFVSATGDDKYGQERAKESAEQRWMDEAKNKFGVKYMDSRNARDGTFECGRSASGSRASEKAAEGVGLFLEQCEMVARPCRSRRERIDK